MMNKESSNNINFNTSLMNSTTELNNMLQIPQSLQNKMQNITAIHESKKAQSQFIINEQQSMNNNNNLSKASIPNQTLIKGKFILAKRLSDTMGQYNPPNLLSTNTIGNNNNNNNNNNNQQNNEKRNINNQQQNVTLQKNNSCHIESSQQLQQLQQSQSQQFYNQQSILSKNGSKNVSQHTIKQVNNNNNNKITNDLEKIKKNNIFNIADNSTLNNKYVEYSSGPRFRDGKVVSYTIVGSPSLFTKYYNNHENLRSSIKEQQAIVRQPRKKNTFKFIDNLNNNNNNNNQNNMNNNNNSNSNFGNGGNSNLQQQQQNNGGQSYHLQTNYSNFNSNNNNNLNQTLSENFSDTRSNFNYQVKSSFRKQQTIGMNMSGMTNMSKKKYKNSDFDEVNKEELLYEMKQTKERIKQQELEQKKKEESMNIEQRHLLNREQRILEKYNKTVSQWVKDLESLSKYSHRKPEEALMMKSDSYRKKVEIINAFESLRSDEQKFGQRIWYMMLRKNNIKSNNKLVSASDQLKVNDEDQEVFLSKSNIRKCVNLSQSSSLARLKDPSIFDSREQTQSDIFSNFMTVTVNNPYKPIEVVRKSLGERRNLNMTQQSFHKTQSSYFVNTQSYLESKIQQNLHLLKNKLVLPNDEDIQELLVEGKNMYDLEYQALSNDGYPNNYKYEKLNFIKAASHQINNNGNQIPNIHNQNQNITTISNGVNNTNNNNNNNNNRMSPKIQDYNYQNRDSHLQSVNELDEEVVYEKQYNILELSKTGRHFFKDL